MMRLRKALGPSGGESAAAGAAVRGRTQAATARAAAVRRSAGTRMGGPFRWDGGTASWVLPPPRRRPSRPRGGPRHASTVVRPLPGGEPSATVLLPRVTGGRFPARPPARQACPGHGSAYADFRRAAPGFGACPPPTGTTTL